MQLTLGLRTRSWVRSAAAREAIFLALMLAGPAVLLRFILSTLAVPWNALEQPLGRIYALQLFRRSRRADQVYGARGAVRNL